MVFHQHKLAAIQNAAVNNFAIVRGISADVVEVAAAMLEGQALPVEPRGKLATTWGSTGKKNNTTINVWPFALFKSKWSHTHLLAPACLLCVKLDVPAAEFFHLLRLAFALALILSAFSFRSTGVGQGGEQ